MRRLLLALALGAAVGAVAVVLFARGDTVQTAAPAEEAEALAGERASLHPGMIMLLARNDGEEPVRIAQVMVNDAYVDFQAQLLTVAPNRQTELALNYPWVAGESYEIGLLTAGGAIVEYELEDAGET